MTTTATLQLVAGPWRDRDGDRVDAYFQLPSGNWLCLDNAGEAEVYAPAGRWMFADDWEVDDADRARDIVGPWPAPIPVPPKPPAMEPGWRLLDGVWNGQEPEEPREGDDANSMRPSQWITLIANPDPGQRKGWRYRRRLPPAPAGWQLAGPDGEVAAGDEWFLPGAAVEQGPMCDTVGAAIVNWRVLLARDRQPSYVIRRESPPLAAGDYVRCPDGKIRQADADSFEFWAGVETVIFGDEARFDLSACRRIVRFAPLAADGLRQLWLDGARLLTPRGKQGLTVQGHDPDCETVLIGDLGWFTCYDLLGTAPNGDTTAGPWRHVAADGSPGHPVGRPIAEGDDG